MDAGGRVVIPAAVRAALELRPGQEFEVRVAAGTMIEIEPVDIPVRLVEEDGLLVLEAEGPVEPSSDDQVREAIELDRDERHRRWR
jgi:AbrB family looped-hinge helix DNA binding protein